jgi:hypothetical protein
MTALLWWTSAPTPDPCRLFVSVPKKTTKGPSWERSQHGAQREPAGRVAHTLPAGFARRPTTKAVILIVAQQRWQHSNRFRLLVNSGLGGVHSPNPPLTFPEIPAQRTCARERNHSLQEGSRSRGDHRRVPMERVVRLRPFSRPWFFMPDALMRADTKRGLGDCFVLVSQEGKWWTGTDWSDDPATAQRFDAEPDPDKAARNAAASIRAETGLSCWPFYVSADQASAFFRERCRGCRRTG